MAPNCKRLDADFIAKMELRAKAEAETDQDCADVEDDAEMSDAEEVESEEDLARFVNLPSNVDSKLWRLKVKPGMER